MIEQQPSRTAFAAAMFRASHQVIDGGAICADPLAVRILQMDEDAVRQEADPARRSMRFLIAARTRFAEDRLAAAMKLRGVTQLVVLGAGLDTFAYRSPLAPHLSIFEVDHPATQAWKRRRLDEVGISAPTNLVFAPVNFERDNLVTALTACGFNPKARSFFIWLGVLPYLTREAIRATLTAVASLEGGGEIAFDYTNPFDQKDLPPEEIAARKALQDRVAAVGEPFISFFETPDLHAELSACGFRTIEDFGPRELLDQLVLKYVPPVTPIAMDSVPVRGPHLLHAATD